MDDFNRTEAKASEILNENGAEKSAPDSSPRKRGRPKGSKNKVRDGAQAAAPENDRFVYIPDEAGQKAAGKAFATLWFLLGPVIQVRPLSEREELEVGAAFDPILQKYVPMYADWKYEINAVMILVGLFQVCHKDYMKQKAAEFAEENEGKQETDSRADVIE